MVTYKTVEGVRAVPLTIPLEAATNKEAVDAYTQRAEKRQKLDEAGGANSSGGAEKKEEPVVPLVPFEACLSRLAAADADSLVAAVARGIDFCVGRAQTLAAAGPAEEGGLRAEAAVRASAGELPRIVREKITWLSDFAVGHFDGELRGFDDGSPSTIGVDC